MAKSKYFTHVEPKLTLIEGWARDGLTDEQIAKNLGISKTSLYKYKEEHIELFELLKKGKEIIDYEVENSLLKKALGFKETIKKAIKIKNVEYENGRRLRETEDIVMVDEEIFVQPDTTAQIFWLKNRRPDKWRDKQVIESNNTIEVKNPLEGLSTEELKEIIKEYKG